MKTANDGAAAKEREMRDASLSLTEELAAVQRQLASERSASTERGQPCSFSPKSSRRALTPTGLTTLPKLKLCK